MLRNIRKLTILTVIMLIFTVFTAKGYDPAVWEGCLYLNNGRVDLEGSTRFDIHPDTGYAEVEKLTDGIWQPASFEVGSNSLWVGRNVGIAGIGHHLATETSDGHIHTIPNSHFQGQVSTSDCGILYAYDYSARVTLQPDNTGTWTGTEQMFSVVSPAHLLANDGYLQTDTTAASANIRYRIYENDIDGHIIFDQWYPPSLFPASSEIKFIAKGYIEFDIGITYFHRITSAANFSLKMDVTNTSPWFASDISYLREDNLLQTAPWVDGGTYTVGQYFINNRKIYVCNVTGVQTGTFASNASKWNLLASSVANSNAQTADLSYDGSAPFTLTGSAWTKITGLVGNKLTGFTLASSTLTHIGDTGVFLVNGNIGIVCPVIATLEYGIAVNGGIISYGTTKANMRDTNLIYNIPLTGIHTISKDDTVEVWLRSDGTTTGITLHTTSLSLSTVYAAEADSITHWSRAGDTLSPDVPGDNVTTSGTITGTTLSGDLSGTINTLTTGVTQSAGNNSTKLATTAYADTAGLGSSIWQRSGSNISPINADDLLTVDRLYQTAFNDDYGLELHVPFDDVGTDIIQLDWSGKQHDANPDLGANPVVTATGGPHNGPVGIFNGTDDFYKVAGSPITGTSSAFTYEGFAYPAVANNGRIITHRATGHTVELLFDTAGQFYMYVQFTDSTALAATSSVHTVDNWYHVAATYDGANIKIYVNGKLEGTTPATKAIDWDTGYIETGLGGNGLVGTYFNGKIYDTKIYSRAISDGEVAAYYLRRGVGVVKAPNFRIRDANLDRFWADATNTLMGSPDGSEQVYVNNDGLHSNSATFHVPAAGWYLNDQTKNRIEITPTHSRYWSPDEVSFHLYTDNTKSALMKAGIPMVESTASYTRVQAPSAGINRRLNVTNDEIELIHDVKVTLHDYTRDRVLVDPTETASISPNGSNQIKTDNTTMQFHDGTRGRVTADSTATALLSPDGTASIQITDGEIDVVGTLNSTGTIATTGSVGIGTLEIPVEPVYGEAKLAIHGTNASADGPHVQYTTTADDFPLMQIFPYSHDAVSINFDCYWDVLTAWQSADSGSNFQIIKTSDELKFNYYKGVSPGTSIPAMDEAMSIDNNGDIEIKENLIVGTNGSAAPANYTYLTLSRWDNDHGSTAIIYQGGGNGSGGYWEDWYADNFYGYKRLWLTSAYDTFYRISNNGAGNVTLQIEGGIQVGDTTVNKTASAGIEIKSTTEALLLSRMTSTERNALTATAGMVIFNTTTSKMECYDGSTWQAAW